MGFLVKRSGPPPAEKRGTPADADVDTVVHEVPRPLTEVSHVMMEAQARQPRLWAWVDTGRRP
jgi:hypothetical protein